MSSINRIFVVDKYFRCKLIFDADSISRTGIDAKDILVSLACMPSFGYAGTDIKRIG